MSLNFHPQTRAQRASTSPTTSTNCTAEDMERLDASGTRIISIDSNDGHVLPGLLARSGDTLLAFSVGVEPDDDEALTTILGSLSRIRHLAVHPLLDDDWVECLQEGWTFTAPHMEYFSFSSIKLPPGLFSGSAPRLRQLDIMTASVDWHSFPDCPLLEELCISEPDPRLSVTAFLQILQKSPLLKKLQVESAFCHSEPRDLRVELLQLEDIELEGHRADCTAQLLNHLVIPEQTRFHIDVNCQDQPTSHLDIIKSLQQCRKTASWSLKSLSVCTSPGFVPALELRIPVENQVTDPGDTGPAMPNLISLTMLSEPVAKVAEILEVLDLRQLSSLSVGSDDIFTDAQLYPDPSFWIALSALPSLQTLKVSYLFALAFLHYLTEDIPRMASSHSVSSPFSSLLHLSYGEYMTEFDPDRVGRLAGMLKSLNDFRGSRLASFTIVPSSLRPNPSTKAALVDGLKAFVPIVDVRREPGLL